MNAPRTKDLSPQLAATARGIATRLRSNDKQAWIVGGAVRDLTLGLEPGDVDLATDARPEEIEALFEETYAVGRAFGTVIVRWSGIDCEVTTFRSESTYSDARHPDEVSFSSTVEQDVLRRDFTCNALYLDPLDDRVLDPAGGLEDLALRRLRCVGDPSERFAEDALRILRLARFAASPGLTPTPETLAAATQLAERLALVAPERRLRELLSICSRPEVTVALDCLQEIDALRWAFFGGDRALAALCHARGAIFRANAGAFEPRAALAVLFGSFDPDSSAEEHLEAMRPSRELLRGAAAVGAGVTELEQLARVGSDSPACVGSGLIRAFRRETFKDSLAVARARASSRNLGLEGLERLETEAAALTEDQLWPDAWIVSSDLAEAGIPRGPEWGELLAEAETRQLDGEDRTREEALTWLRSRAQDGGNKPRSNQDAG